MGLKSGLDDETKKKAIARVRAGESREEVGRSLGVSGTSVGQWIRKFAEVAVKAEPKKRANRSSKRRAAKPKSAAREAPVTLLASHHVVDEWSLPHPLGELVVCAELLRDFDDFEALARLEKAVTVQRELMERRAEA